MNKNRLEAFSDGVLAIIITIMVLEVKIPHDPSWLALKAMCPTIISYILSYIYIGIYWNNHHHMLQAVQKVSGGVLWANLHLLFWLSLVPFATAWMGENDFQGPPVALYGVLLFMSGIAFSILARALVQLHGQDSLLAKALGQNFKSKLSIVLYALGVAVAFKWSYVSFTLYTFVAIMWLVPDQRIEKRVSATHTHSK